MEPMGASTPSPASGIHTPPTPKHGYADSWEPFSPRKSARLSSQRAAVNRTPSPSLSTRTSHSHQLRSPRTARKDSGLDDLTMATPVTSPHKKRQPPVEAARRASGPLTADSTSRAAAALGLDGKTDARPAPSANRPGRTGMLPTPAKTPARKHSEQNEKNIRAIARNLFTPEEELMPSPRKRRAKKYTGISMDSFIAEDVEEPIQIFTDSHERIPEVDLSTDNPFYGESSTAAPQPVRRRSKRRSVAVPGGGSQTVDEAMRREDGLVYVFRGKKIFRTFAESEEALKAQSNERDGDEEADGGVEAHLRRPLTRSSLKPKLLFPTHHAQRQDLATSHEDEEAVTDIEDHVVVQDGNAGKEEPETPQEAVDETPSTPTAPKFAPASPPVTSRTTRSGNKAAEDTTPVKSVRGSKRSPFDGWRRVKNGAAAQGHKRAGETLASDAAPKRTRS